MPLDRILTHTLKPRWNARENSGPPAFAWRIPGLKSETWGTPSSYPEGSHTDSDLLGLRGYFSSELKSTFSPILQPPTFLFTRR